MCYYALYLFLTCGHCIPSRAPLAHARSPPCPARSRALFRDPRLASPTDPWAAAAPGPSSPGAPPSPSPAHPSSDPDADRAGSLGECCREKLSHPLHTYRIAGLCRRCESKREERLARFEVGCIRDGVEREMARLERNGGSAEAQAKGPGLRSGYTEGRGSERKKEKGRGVGMILQRNANSCEDGNFFESIAEEELELQLDVEDKAAAAAAAAMGWDLETGAFEGKTSGRWTTGSSMTE